MSSTELQQPVLEGGVRSINFFNGRLLSAEDLSKEQEVSREGRQRLGQAIGEGIIDGLQVTLNTSSPDPLKASVHVMAGSALNRNGQLFTLPKETDVALVATRTQQAISAGLFGACEPPQSTPVVTGSGVYILTLSPVSGFDGKASVSGLAGVAGGTSCGSRYKVEGVRFGLVPLDLTTLSGNSGTQALISDIQSLISQLANQSDSASLSKLRNLLAHLCFGTEERKGFVVEPFRQTTDGSSPYIDVGALTALRGLRLLTDCDVPLALLFWTTNGVQFVDMGSVRRRPVSGPPSQFWPMAVAGGYPITGEAVSIQFQEQIADITRASTPQDQLALFGASDAFGYLPSVGLIPITGANSARGFVIPKFFQNIPHRDPIFIEGARLEHLVRIALAYPPIKLVGSLIDQEMIWLYAVRENAQAIDNSLLNPPQRYLVFTSGHIPYQGDAQYDLARAQYSNYSSVMTR